MACGKFAAGRGPVRMNRPLFCDPLPEELSIVPEELGIEDRFLAMQTGTNTDEKGRKKTKQRGQNVN